ncbi:MAG: hypothetical protein ACRC0X_09045 [Brevinema sp.]
MYKGAYIRIPKKSLELFLREVVFRYNVKDHKERAMIILTILLNTQAINTAMISIQKVA